MANSSLLIQVAILGGIVLVLSNYILAYLSSPLKKLPGPFLARFSDWWRFWNHVSKTHIETQQNLHKKYGKAIRIGPNTVSLSDPELVKTIYSTRGNFLKSDYYSINDALQGRHIIPNIFSTRSNEFHSKALRPVQKLYSFQSAYELEPLINETIRFLCLQLEERFIEGPNAGKTCDIADWISYYAWDILSETTFSKRMGFLEQGNDVGNTIAKAETIMRYFSVIGQIPVLDKWLGKNPWCPIKFADFSVPAGFAVQQFMARVQNPEDMKKKDFMNDFIATKEEFPEFVGDNEVIGYLILNILGGADTTAIVQKAIFYYILKTPAAHKKLCEELNAAGLAFPSPYKVVEALPYLDACIKEGLRMHPVVGHIIERVVPQSGLTLGDGTALPPGTIVGINPWTVHYNEEIFGEKTNEFRPERWLQGPNESAAAYEARTRKMKDADMSFGGGNRVCLGRPLALVELYKVTATLFGRYDMQLENPNKSWDLHKQWFVWPHDIKIKMKLRNN